MAATAGIINGTDLLVYDGTHVIAHSTSCSLALNQEMRDASTKASSGWKAVLPGQRSWSIEVQGLVALDASYNLAYLIALINNKTRVALKWKTANVDDFYYSGYGYLTSVNADAPNQGNTTYTGSFTGDGALSLNSIASPPDPWQIVDTSVTAESGGYYNMTSSQDIIITLPAITTVTDAIVIKNTSIAGAIEVATTSPDTINTSYTSIYLAADKNVTLIPAGSTFSATGDFSTSAP